MQVRLTVLVGSFLWVIFATYATQSHAFADKESEHALLECPYDPSKDGGIELSIVEPNYDNSGYLDTSKNLADVREAASKLNSGPSSSVVAFADVSFGISYTYTTRYFKLPNEDTECHWIEKVTVKFELKKPPTILFPKELYEAREEDGGVCYDQIYAHEMQHVQDYETVFEDIVVKTEQDRRFEPGFSLPSKYQTLAIDTSASGTNSAQSLLEQLIKEHYTPVIRNTIAEITSDMRYRGGLLDSTLEYQRITDLCSEMIDYIK